MTPTNFRLLRRTAMAVAAAVGLFASLATEAAVVTLSGANGSTCSYSTMSITPDGNVTVQCSGTTAPPPSNTGDAGAFSIAANQGLANVGDQPTLTITRSVGSSGSVNVPYSLTGSGCTNGSGNASFADGAGSYSFGVPMVAAGTCTVSLGTPTTAAAVATGPRVGSPSSATVSVQSPQPAPGAAGCAAPPADMLTASFKSIGAVLLQMQKSGQVVSIPLPEVVSGFHSGQLVISESAGGAFTPQPVSLNVTISKCPGVVDTDQSNSCNIVTTNGNYNAVTWFAAPYSSIQDPPSAQRYGFCWAPRSEGQWYMNARWNYSSCAFGAAVCGFAIQQNYGSY
ncbi:MAG TPA: hypothetical protein VNU21_04735 [Usitatibacter sp.]|jgi:hypothetical protein|nr:hypothetical protein [Usitatibacter sp.]